MGRKNSSGGGVYADYWHIPGGGVHQSEDKITALKREVLEETNINVNKFPISLVDDKGFGTSPKRINGDMVLCEMTFFVYKIKLDKKASDIIPSPTDDLVELNWVDVDKLGDYQLAPPSVSLFQRLGIL